LPHAHDDGALAAQVRRATALRIGLLEAGYDLIASRKMAAREPIVVSEIT